mgnify:CR=1 FL=1
MEVNAINIEHYNALNRTFAQGDEEDDQILEAGDEQSNRSALETHASREDGSGEGNSEIIDPPTAEELAELEEEDVKLLDSSSGNREVVSQIAQIINQS